MDGELLLVAQFGLSGQVTFKFTFDLVKSDGQANEQYFAASEHIHSPYGKLGFGKSTQVTIVPLVVLGTVVVDAFGRHLNPSRASKPTVKSNRA